MRINNCNTNQPVWQPVVVKSHVPEALQELSEMAHNIWWVWNYEAIHMFRDMDSQIWSESGHNPVVLLERLSYEKLEQIAKDETFLSRMHQVYSKFRAYMDVKPDSSRASVAYFCMEYGMANTLKIYSGGLGILAGDYIKEASDSNVDMCAVGFLYRYGYFNQTLSMDGQQVAEYQAQNFGSLPIERVMDNDGQPLELEVPYMNYVVYTNV